MNLPLSPGSGDALRHSSAQLTTTLVAGLREIWAHKFRSLLTILGIIIGIGAGIFPAYLASRMPPVEALGSET